jgi:hypothetical protein
LLSKKTARMGDEAKPLAATHPRWRLCCVNFGLFVLAITSRKIEMQSDARASDITRPMIVPHTAERRKLSLGGTPGFLFWRTA